MLSSVAVLSSIILAVASVNLQNNINDQIIDTKQPNGYLILTNEASIKYEKTKTLPFELPNSISIYDASSSLSLEDLENSNTKRKLFFLNSNDKFINTFFNTLKDDDIYYFDTYSNQDSLNLEGEKIIPNDQYLNKQWGLENINAFEAWRIQTGSKNVKVGVIDTGISKDNPDLIDNYSEDLSYGVGLLAGDPGVDPNGHGTNVAGIIGAKGNNGVNFSGVSWDVTLVSLKLPLLNNSFMPWDLVEAINKASELNLPIVNYSIGGDGEDLSIKQAIENYNGLFVCSAGNKNLNIDEVFYTAGSFTLDNIICVGNSDKSNKKYKESCYGKNSVDLFAPGVQIYNTTPDNKNTVYYTGTSQSAPHVAGTAALLLSENPNLETDDLKSAILDNVTPISSLTPYCKTGGVLNANKALEEVHSYHHEYDRDYKWLNYEKHLATCRCGEVLEMPHIVSSKKPSGSKYYTCLLCGGSAEIGLTIIPSNNSESSSDFTITSNGVIVVNEDLAYKIKNEGLYIYDLIEGAS